MKKKLECDVLVVGGGAAGIAASLAAARTGAQTLLLEKYGFCGGLATAGLVGTICGLFLRDPKPDPSYVCHGFTREWAERLAQASSSHSIHLGDGLHVLPYDPWAFKCLADQVLGETRNLDVILHGTLASVLVQDRSLIEAQAVTRNERIVIQSGAFVDATGDALVAQFADGRVEEETGAQAVALVFSMDGVDPVPEDPSSRLALLREIGRAVEKGQVSPECRFLSFIPPLPGRRQVYLKINFPWPGDSGGNALSGLEMKARSLVNEIAHFLTSSVPAFYQARVSQVASQIGIRIGTRACGRRVLTEEDLLASRKFEDGVARGCWPMEEWAADARCRMTFLPERDYYEIPMGCLIEDGFENLFVAGRCISASKRALASARVIGTALSTGWAAGAAAAFHALGRPLSLAVKRIREEQKNS